MNTDNNIKCPKCGENINVNEVLYHQLEETIRKDFDAKSAGKAKEIEKQLQEIEAQKEKLQQEKTDLNITVVKEVESKLKIEKGALEKTIRDKVTNETSEQLQELQKELTEKSEKVRELNKSKAEIERLKREKEELHDTIVLEQERAFSDKLKDERLKIRTQVGEESALKVKELEKQLDDQKKLVDEMKRKAEQGSMQMQGEVQELAIEEILAAMFPFDIISEVGKGVKGADVIQTVRNKIGTECGIILYESKRTKAFSQEWVKKLKADAPLTKADILVIITEAMPDGIERIGSIDGVWICSFADFRGLILALRDSLIKIHDAYTSQANSGEKMQMLYLYLTSNEFKLQIGAIVDGFTELQESYIQEKNAMEKLWKKREKQLQKVLLNTNHFIGSIQGIAGSSMAHLKQIESSHSIVELDENNT